MERRLAAIMAADVVGYSRLIRADEEGTIAALKALRADLIAPKLAEHNGRIVKLMGDGMLAEFASVVDAVRAAVETQQAVAEHNADVPEDKRIEFRVGINLGDVVIDGDDIYGDGVNVAARLEGLAKPGGICISDKVYEEVRDRIDFPFEDLGKRDLKNIDRPVRIWRWLKDMSGTAAAEPEASELPPLPDKPSIAVLPFENMSGDPEQEYFSDGIAEDIITALSRFHWFFVIARNSSFTLKGKAVDVRQVAQEFGVRYVLEGSVRKAGGRVRISAQLVDAVSDRHVWAEHYDRKLEDIFAVQDEITERVAAAVGPELFRAEMQRVRRKDVTSLDGWERLMRGFWHLWHFSREHNAQAQYWFQHATELDPNSASAFGGLAICHVIDANFGWSDSVERSNAAAVHTAHKAVELDDRSAYAHTALGMAYRNLERHDDAIAEFERAIELNANYAPPYGQIGRTLAFAGKIDDAIANIEMAMRLSPRDPLMALWLASLGLAAFVAERYEEACNWAKKAVRENSDFPVGHQLLVASYGQLERPREAEAALKGLFRVMPSATLASMKRQLHFKNAAELDRFMDALRKAGLPG